MRILIFGATGMVGQSVLRECLAAADVSQVVSVGRSSLPPQPRLTSLVAADPSDLSALESQLAPFDACFFCIGVSSVGMNESDYTRITHDLTLTVARTLVRLDPKMTFTYVTGAGTDANSRSMWARVKGRTEQALLALGFRAVYLFRPGVIVPLHAVRSKTALYQAAYVASKPIFAAIRAIRPDALVTSVDIGQAMLAVARHGYPKPVLEVADIKQAARSAGGS